MIFKRRDIIVTNGELCLCIDLITIENKKYNLQLEYERNHHIIEMKTHQINQIITKFSLNNAFQ